MTPITPLEVGGEMFQRAKTPSFLHGVGISRPASQATDAAYTDFEDGDSDFEDDSLRGSSESVSLCTLRLHLSLTMSRLTVDGGVRPQFHRTMTSLHPNPKSTGHSKFSSSLYRGPLDPISSERLRSPLISLLTVPFNCHPSSLGTSRLELIPPALNKQWYNKCRSRNQIRH